MGNKKSNKKNQLKQLILAILILIILVILSKTEIIEKTNVEISPQIVENISENIIIDQNKLNILYFDVGQADSQLITYKEKTLLIDAGNIKDGEKLVNGIKNLGITKLDYVIGTHVHEDHIGGMSYIIDEFKIGEFYLPYNTKTTSNYYKTLLTSLMKKEVGITEANIGDKIQLEDIVCEIMSVDNSEPEDANNSSIVVQINYGNLKYLFMGDATSKNEKSRNWEDIDVLKVGHHGSITSSSEEFLNSILPEIAIISVGKENNYQLPKDKIIERLQKNGSTIYRTDKDGTIQISSDGITNEITKIDISFDGN